MTVSIGLALGGGAIRGAAHIGVLQALEEQGIKPDYISGSSVGALVAALYAFGKSPEEILDIANGTSWFDISRLTKPSTGLLSNKDMQKVLYKAVGDVNIEEANIPLAAIAANIENGNKVILKEGNLANAIMASACIPGVFKPVEINGELLVDGGVVENVPISPLIEMGAELIIAIELNGKMRFETPKTITDVIMNAFDIAIATRTQIQTSRADILISPDLSMYSFSDTKNVTAMYEIGYQEGLKYKDTIALQIKDCELRHGGLAKRLMHGKLLEKKQQLKLNLKQLKTYLD